MDLLIVLLVILLVLAFVGAVAFDTLLWIAVLAIIVVLIARFAGRDRYSRF